MQTRVSRFVVTFPSRDPDSWSVVDEWPDADSVAANVGFRTEEDAEAFLEELKARLTERREAASSAG